MKSEINKGMILVLEDERSLLTAITRKLTSSGFVVVGAQTVQRARSLLEENKCVSAVWLDHYVLGEGSGLDLAVDIRTQRALQHILVFVVSNTASSDKIEAYEELGVSKYFTKSNYRLEDIIGHITEEITA